MQNAKLLLYSLPSDTSISMADSRADDDLVPLPLDLGHERFSGEGEDLVFRVFPVGEMEREKKR